MSELSPIMQRTSEETTALSTYAASPTEILERRAIVKEVMDKVMVEGTHYGKIPGTDKPTLLKPGSEVLCSTFRIAPTYGISDLSGETMIRYQVVCRGIHQNTAILLGEGMGECATMEEKYRWRKAVSQAEFDNTPDSLCRVKYGVDYKTKREWQVNQVQTNHFDLGNTILKMACKRALAAMVLNVTAASDMFDQDLEDMPANLRQSQDQSTRQQPQSNRSGGHKYATEQQVKLILAQLAKASIDPKDFLNEYKVDDINKFPFADVNGALDWIKENAQEGADLGK